MKRVKYPKLACGSIYYEYIFLLGEIWPLWPPSSFPGYAFDPHGMVFVFPIIKFLFLQALLAMVQNFFWICLICILWHLSVCSLFKLEACLCTWDLTRERSRTSATSVTRDLQSRNGCGYTVELTLEKNPMLAIRSDWNWRHFCAILCWQKK